MKRRQVTHALLLVLALLTFARGAWLVLHHPLLGLANSFDEVRYSSCFDLAPLRPGVPAAQFNPQAPLRLFTFYDGYPPDVCVWTSDLLFTAPVAYAWKLSELLGGSAVHSIHKLGALRLLLWCLAITWFMRAWLASGRADAACALAVCAGAIFFDPANTLLFNTWYAEPAATFGLFLCGAGALLTVQSAQRAAWLITVVGAAVLAGSKMQHILLPLLLGFACALAGGRAARPAARALLLGGLLGAAFCAAGAMRPASHGVELANRGNFVLMVLLPNSAHPTETAARIGLDVDCASHAGPHGIWAMPQPIESSCPSIATVSSLHAWSALISEPAALARALSSFPDWLLPWVSTELGLVEGENYAHLPATQWSVDRLLGADPRAATALLILPWLMLIVVLALRAGPLARCCAAMCALTALEVPLVSMFGDGFSDFAKHSQLAVVASLTSLSVPLAWLMRKFASAELAAREV